MYREKIGKLMEVVSKGPYAEDDLDFVESRMKAFTDYMGHVAWMETRIQRLNIEGVKGEEWRDAVTKLDDMKRSKHNVAMDAINQLNRMSVANGLGLFYEGAVDHEHRTQVGDLIGDIVYEYFQGRDGRTLKKEDLMEGFAEAVETISSSGSPGIVQ